MFHPLLVIEFLLFIFSHVLKVFLRVFQNFLLVSVGVSGIPWLVINMNRLWGISIFQITIIDVRIVIINLTRLLSNDRRLNLFLRVHFLFLEVHAWLLWLREIWLSFQKGVLILSINVIFILFISVIRFLLNLKFFKLFLESN